MILDNLFTLTEGISSEDLADVLARRLEARYPEVFQRYNIERIADAVMDRAEFHAGAEELGTSDIGIMLREILQTLERDTEHLKTTESSTQSAKNSLSTQRPDPRLQDIGRRMLELNKLYAQAQQMKDARLVEKIKQALSRLAAEKMRLQGPALNEAPRGSTEPLQVGDDVIIRDLNTGTYGARGRVESIEGDKIMVGGPNLITLPYDRKSLQLVARPINDGNDFLQVGDYVIIRDLNQGTYGVKAQVKSIKGDKIMVGGPNLLTLPYERKSLQLVARPMAQDVTEMQPGQPRTPYDAGGADAWYHRGQHPEQFDSEEDRAEYLRGYRDEGVTRRDQGKQFEAVEKGSSNPTDIGIKENFSARHVPGSKIKTPGGGEREISHFTPKTPEQRKKDFENWGKKSGDKDPKKNDVAEGDVIRTKFATKQAQRAQDQYQHQPDVEIPVYDRERDRAVLPKYAQEGVSEGDEQNYRVTYDMYGSNREKPLYTNTRTVRASSEEEAIKILRDLIGGRNHRIEKAVAEGSEIQVPTEDGIGWQDIRLLAGEGKLTQKTIKQAIDIIRRQRKERGVAEGSMPYPHGKPEAGDKITWYHSNHYPSIEGTVVGWKDGHLIVKSIDPSPQNTEKTVVKYRVPKNNILSVEKQGVAEGEQRGLLEKQDACYHKVRSRYKVWPSAYASGALVQCRKKGAANWGTGGKKK